MFYALSHAGNLTPFLDIMVKFVRDVVNLFDSYSFDLNFGITKITVSLWGILSGAIIVSMVVSFLWRGAKG